MIDNREKDSGPVQQKMTDYGEYSEPLDPKEQERKRLIRELRRHIEEYTRLRLKLHPGNSIEYGRFQGEIVTELLKMEKKNICYIKTPKKGRTRIYKQRFCPKPIEIWKKCPEFRCPLSVSIHELPCPHEESGHTTQAASWNQTQNVQAT